VPGLPKHFKKLHLGSNYEVSDSAGPYQIQSDRRDRSYQNSRLISLFVIKQRVKLMLAHVEAELSLQPLTCRSAFLRSATYFVQPFRGRNLYTEISSVEERPSPAAVSGRLFRVHPESTHSCLEFIENSSPPSLSVSSFPS
jgi:hypothetical protein